MEVTLPYRKPCFLSPSGSLPCLSLVHQVLDYLCANSGLLLMGEDAENSSLNWKCLQNSGGGYLDTTVKGKTVLLGFILT